MNNLRNLKAAWIVRTEECGIMGVYSSKKRAIIAANWHLACGFAKKPSGKPSAELEKYLLNKEHKNYVCSENKYHVFMSTDYDYVTVEQFKINL